MHDIIETSERTASAASTLRPAEMAWQTPESTVVETALEVTAYSLSTR
ncbi:pyrroloquinoline quinone precursor peptide PqqA [Streptomyces sp. NPDC006733]